MFVLEKSVVFNENVLGSEKTKKESRMLYISKLSVAFPRVSLVILLGMMWRSEIMDFES